MGKRKTGAKSIRISFRLTPDFFQLLKRNSKQFNMNVTKFITFSVTETLNHRRQKLEETGKQLLINVNCTNKNEEITKANWYIHIIRNCYRSIFQHANATRFNLNEINIKAIRYIIDKYVSLYNEFPDKIKRILKKDIREIKKLKNKEYLATKLPMIVEYNTIKNVNPIQLDYKNDQTE